MDYVRLVLILISVSHPKKLPNSIISAHLLTGSISRTAYNKAQQKGLLLYSNDTIRELVEVFSRKKFDKYITVVDRNEAIAAYINRSIFVDVTLQISACRDFKDNKFLELAISGMAVSIITGDKDLLTLHPFQSISIISPAAFVASL